MNSEISFLYEFHFLSHFRSRWRNLVRSLNFTSLSAWKFLKIFALSLPFPFTLVSLASSQFVKFHFMLGIVCVCVFCVFVAFLPFIVSCFVVHSATLFLSQLLYSIIELSIHFAPFIGGGRRVWKREKCFAIYGIHHNLLRCKTIAAKTEQKRMKRFYYVL